MTKKTGAISVAMIQDESGQDLIEYALVAGLIGLGWFAPCPGSPARLQTLSTLSATP
jgi:hypothetical protein